MNIEHLGIKTSVVREQNIINLPEILKENFKCKPAKKIKK